MRIIHYLMVILFLATLAAACVSVQRDKALTLGVGVLVVPLAFRLLIGISK